MTESADTPMPVAGEASAPTAPRVRAIRGATTLEGDTRKEVISRTQELLAQILQRNDLDQEDVVSILFTATEDISSAFPAEAAREAGIGLVPLLCARELEIEGGVERCIRVLLHVYTTRAPTELRHVYLHGARQLRTDLPE
ncbi:MAG: chorismate mutase [Actinomycetota bacterium]|nr:chorismate mutase [Actinomycetota bacterium]